jgi:uncharacterized protein YkwD
MRYLSIILLCGSLFACHAGRNTAPTKPTPQPSVSNTVTPAPTTQTDIQSQMTASVNALRAKGCTCGGTAYPAAGALTWNDKLYAAALAQAKDMATSGRISHTSSDGADLPTRVGRAGYAYSMIAENVCEGAESIDEAIALWKGSTGHCKNMLKGEFTDFGAARVGNYWAQVFGKPLK